MHHAFPRECPHPHLSGTTNPQTPDEWLESTGEETTATDEEMQVHVDKANTTEVEEEEVIAPLPWSSEEELLVVRPPEIKAAVGSTLLSNIRNVLLFMAMVSVAYGLVHSSLASPTTKGDVNSEKFLV